MKYVALLRGINVGGKSIIKMSALIALFESLDFKNVTSYIQSGNVIFQSNTENVPQIIQKIEIAIGKRFQMNVRVVVLNELQMNEVMNNVPDEWNKNVDIRCYIAFIIPPAKSETIGNQIQLQESVDFIKISQSAIYMTTRMSGLMNSRFKNMIGKPYYKELTMRNFNSSKAILDIMKSGNEIDAYMHNFSSDVRRRLEQIRSIILKEVPEAVEVMSYGMPGYKLNTKPLVYFAAFKNHIGLYATPSGHTKFSKELSKYKHGKGSVQFPLSSPLPLELIRDIVMYRKKEIISNA